MAQAWTYALIFYFVGVVLILGVIPAEVMGDVRFTALPGIHGETNTSLSVERPPGESAWNAGEYLQVLFGFFVFGLDLGLGNGMWIVRIIFVYIPLTMLVITIWHSLPFISS